MEKAPFENLRIWNESYTLALEVYDICRKFPKYELYALADQLRRSSVSIPANIAEGYGRFSNSELRRYLNIAKGSAYETIVHLMIARDNCYMETSIANNILLRYRKLSSSITAFIKVIPSTRHPAPRTKNHP
jgi:four helix bundle protein